VKHPLVSVITPSFNQGKFIKETILSVFSQNYDNIEYIIMDGGSTDNTLNVIRKFGKKLKCISEPDYGQADAVNKGFLLAKGEILGWLNSDDTLNPGALDRIVKQFTKDPHLIMVYSDANFIDKDGNVIGEYPTEDFSLNRMADNCFLCQPTVFIKAEVFKEIGMFDIHLHTCMDYDYWIRIGKHFSVDRISYMKGIYNANSRMHNENKTISSRKKVYMESMKIQKKYFGTISKRWILAYIKEIMFKKSLKISDL